MHNTSKGTTNLMQKSDFYFDLPQELIAQTPCIPRDASKMLCLDRQGKSITHSKFSNILELLNEGDVLCVNNSKVLPARLIGQKVNGGAVCEILLLREKEADVWECLAKPGKRLKQGATVIFGDGSLSATILSTTDDGNKIVKFTYNTNNLYEKLDEFGSMPLPPYIQTKLDDNSKYQTVYAKELGSAAAPTAGLHFTEELLQALKSKGVVITYITLHVGLGTFRPVKENDILKHKMHSEWYTLTNETAQEINKAKQNGKRVIAVGTTTCRTLESVFAKHNKIAPCSGDTDIFIYPGFEFKVLNGLITNFHLPESTLIMLVSAFCGYENTMNAYKVAVENNYRFFSFGDAMFIADFT